MPFAALLCIYMQAIPVLLCSFVGVRAISRCLWSGAKPEESGSTLLMSTGIISFSSSQWAAAGKGLFFILPTYVRLPANHVPVHNVPWSQHPSNQGDYSYFAFTNVYREELSCIFLSTLPISSSLSVFAGFSSLFFV